MPRTPSQTDDPSSSTGGSGEEPRGSLQGLRVIDAATLFAGPLAATMMADFGAEVIKVEHP